MNAAWKTGRLLFLFSACNCAEKLYNFRKKSNNIYRETSFFRIVIGDGCRNFVCI